MCAKPFLCALIVGFAAARFGSAFTFTPGVSAWAYGVNPSWDTQILNYNASAGAGKQFQYFFPYACSADIPSSGVFNLSYSDPDAAHYRALLPGAKILPIIDCTRASALNFDNWSNAQYYQAASTVAQAILADPDADGVHFDFEPYSASWLPFFSDLRQMLGPANKIVSLFTGQSSPQLFQDVDLVAISGYDLGSSGGTAESPDSYYSALSGEVNKFSGDAAAAGGGHFLVGIPAIASTTEFESYNCVPSGYLQSQYIGQAESVLCQHAADPGLVGASLWGFLGGGGSCGGTEEPLTISSGVWSALEAPCAAPTATPAPSGTFRINQFTASPNPATGSQAAFYFSFSGPADQADIEVYTAGYRLVYQQNLPATQFAGNQVWSQGWNLQDLNGTPLSNGVYFALLRAQGLDGHAAQAAIPVLRAR